MMQQPTPKTGQQFAAYIKNILLQNEPGQWDIITNPELEQEGEWTIQATTSEGKTFDVVIREIC